MIKEREDGSKVGWCIELSQNVCKETFGKYKNKHKNVCCKINFYASRYKWLNIYFFHFHINNFINNSLYGVRHIPQSREILVPKGSEDKISNDNVLKD